MPDAGRCNAKSGAVNPLENSASVGLDDRRPTSGFDSCSTLSSSAD